VDHLVPGLGALPSGLTAPQLAALLAGLLATAEVFSLLSQVVLGYQGKPVVEGMMVGRIYRLLAIIAVIMGTAYGFGALATFGTFFSLFGGMLLGWSLQAPVSGFAAWILVSVKRPFRPGDRIQFPSLGLTGDVKDMGPMYTILDQVGGTIGSEEAVGRHILVPNAMLFSQVVINYTVLQDSPYMLDETIVRITFNSDWQAAENILLEAAIGATRDIIDVTGVEPYIRADPYDYGVFMRLRYQTRVKDRAEIAYRINRRIFEQMQGSESVDLAIPFVYSSRKGAESKEMEPGRRQTDEAVILDIDRIESTVQVDDKAEIEQAARSMSPQWLHHPIVVQPAERAGTYRIVAGHLQYEVCKLLGWKTMSVIVATQRHFTPTSLELPSPAPGLVTVVKERQPVI